MEKLVNIYERAICSYLSLQFSYNALLYGCLPLLQVYNRYWWDSYRRNSRKRSTTECIFHYIALLIECLFNKNSLLQSCCFIRTYNFFPVFRSIFRLCTRVQLEESVCSVVLCISICIRWCTTQRVH